MARENGEYAHPELVGGGDTTKHSHAGGGGTASKSGAIEVPSVSWTTVTFNTAFGDANYAISFGASTPPTAADHKGIFYQNKATTGFEIWQKEKAGDTIYIDWVATPYNDS